MSGRSREDERGLARRQYQDPFTLVDRMFERMQREFFGPSILGSLFPSSVPEGDEEMVRVPRLRVRDADDAITVKAELPGLDPKDINIELQDDVLTIRGETRHEEQNEERHAERQVTYFRQVRVPENVDTEQVQATCEHGVLSIRFPKRAQWQNVRQIPISSGSREQQPKGDKDRAA